MKDAQEFSRRSLLKGALLLGGAGICTAALGPALAPDREARAEDAVDKDAEASAQATPETTSAQTLSPDLIKAEEYDDKQIVDCDLLIIGSGFAGLFAALTAAEEGVGSIALVDKGAIAQSSVASMTLGATAYVIEDDDIYGCMEELVKVADYLSRQDMWEDMLSTSNECYDKIRSWGVGYAGDRRTSDGNTYTKLSSGINYQDKRAGKAMIAALLDQLRAKDGIRYFSKTVVTRLLKDGEKVVGAAGFSRMSGNTVAFRAKATILAAGKCSFKGQHAMGEVETGDSYALAYDAGAVLNNMEFLAYDIDPVYYQMEGGSLFGMFGARIINKDYDDFMWKYDPTFGPISDARYTSRAFAQEVKEGRGPVYLDRTTFMYRLAGQHMLGTIYPEGSWQMENERKIAEAGFDVLTTPEPFTANAFGIVGAVKAEVDCSTALPGLFVASTAISHDPGKTKGIESARAFWSGERSARTAAAYISTQPDPSLGESEVSELLNEITRPLGAGGSYRPGEVILELQQSLFHYTVNLLKSEEAMLRALAVVRQCRQKAMQMSAADPHELATYYEASNMVMLAELHLLAAIERRESRVCHYREDYPKTDNDNWLKWINFTKGAAGEPVMAFEDIPIATYRFQPTKEA